MRRANDCEHEAWGLSILYTWARIVGSLYTLYLSTNRGVSLYFILEHESWARIGIMRHDHGHAPVHVSVDTVFMLVRSGVRGAALEGWRSWCGVRDRKHSPERRGAGRLRPGTASRDNHRIVSIIAMGSAQTTNPINGRLVIDCT